ncbi:MAG TPA: acyl--CoA ligase family protein [Solirubrobacteraceae bacterium]|nr:acyl--CoA ligase family protein [Solirubrobacteraceae bacterium]
MTDALTASQDAPAREAAAKKTFRTELNPVDFLRRAAYIYPDKIAVVDGERRYSYRQLAERSWRLANALRDAGLRKGDRVAALLFNSGPMLEAHFGVPAAGGVLVAVNNRLASAEVGYILEHSGARFLLVDAELRALVPDHVGAEIAVIDVTGADPTGDAYEQFLAAASPVTPESWLEDEEETISINYTSGTTGQPKGVQYTYRGAYLNALSEVIVAGMNPDSVYLWTLPMFHCNGWCFPWAVTATGARHVALRAIDAGVIWRLIDEEGITHYNGAPTVQLMVINHPAAHRLEQAVTAMVAAAPPSPTLLARMAELNFRIVHVYGLTETYGPITVCPAQEAWHELPIAERAKLLSRQGQGYPTADLIRVVDEEMRDVAQDGETMGEVVMRGNNVMSGYLADETATDRAFRGGWFHSGDLAVWHPDGNIELRDRGKDIIISGGENISSIEVEQAIAAHPAVLECAVVGIPHDYWGERPKAFVTLKPGASATAEEVIAFCRERLAHYKCPDAVEFGPLPKTSTGKVQKFVLREREWQDRETRVGAT